MGTGGSGSNVGDTYGSHDDGFDGGGGGRVGEDSGNAVKENGTSETHNSLPPDDSQLKHMFRNDRGHLPDTPDNRKLIEDMVNDADCKVGTDGRGLDWYERYDEDGNQIWASVRNGVVQNCGKSEDPRPWDSETGFSANRPKRNGFGGE